jgi:hypothetical protein
MFRWFNRRLHWCGPLSSSSIGNEIPKGIGFETWMGFGSSTGDRQNESGNGSSCESSICFESGIETSIEIWSENRSESGIESRAPAEFGVAFRRALVRLCGRLRNPFLAGWRTRRCPRPVSDGGRWCR